MTDKQAAKQAKRRALQEKFSAKLTERVEEIDLSWQAVSHRPGSLGLEHPFYRQVHSLAGAAGTFGYTGLG
ncbi:MAG: diguanylate cyclase, partial [Pseudomonadota bacterium]